jgi:hypothetical protein
MKKNKYLFLLILWVPIFSCNKSDSLSNNGYPSNYHKAGIMTNGNIRVFSLTGEIRSQSVISRFNNSDSSVFSYFADDIGNKPGRMDSIKFSDALHAIMNDNRMPLNCLVSRGKGTFLLTRTDTSFGTTTPNEMSHSISYYIGQEKPELFSEYLVSSTRGEYIFGYSAREKFILNISGGLILAPLILYRFYPSGQNSGVYYNGYINNILQNDFYKNIEVDDTVTIQEYMVLYEK